jgi:hypothetical protein
MSVEQMMRDIDPTRVAASIAHRLCFMAEVDALPDARCCTTGMCNHDGSCLACGDDQGECSRCTRRIPTPSPTSEIARLGGDGV